MRMTPENFGSMTYKARMLWIARKRGYIAGIDRDMNAMRKERQSLMDQLGKYLPIHRDATNKEASAPCPKQGCILHSNHGGYHNVPLGWPEAPMTVTHGYTAPADPQPGDLWVVPPTGESTRCGTVGPFGRCALQQGHGEMHQLTASGADISWRRAPSTPEAKPECGEVHPHSASIVCTREAGHVGMHVSKTIAWYGKPTSDCAHTAAISGRPHRCVKVYGHDGAHEMHPVLVARKFGATFPISQDLISGLFTGYKFTDQVRKPEPAKCRAILDPRRHTQVGSMVICRRVEDHKDYHASEDGLYWHDTHTVGYVR